MSKLQIHYLFIVMIVYDNTITEVSETAVGLCFCQLMTKISSFDVGWRICNLKTCVNSKFACFWIDYTVYHRIIVYLICYVASCVKVKTDSKRSTTTYSLPLL